ncbi:MAG: phosphate ABC transporter substrate-binding protein [Desulfobacterales bacterium]|nr:phosphate ABC transporter substrate-binding protein [Desulfobacterales bacterium]
MKMKKLLITLIFGLICTGLTLGTAWAESLVMKGSTTVLPIAQQAAETFMNEYPDVQISVSGGGSGNGIKALVDGTTDIANASRFIKQKEVARAVENGHYPVPFGIAFDCIVPVVHNSNPVDDLSVDELKKIYQGKIKNWSEVGGKDMQIVVVSRDTSSGTYEVWEEKVLEGGRVFPGALLQASNGAVSQAVSKNKYAIGYIGLSYLNKEVKDLKVKGVRASKDTAAAYPVSRTLYMFTDGWPEGVTLQFMNWIMHPEKGQKVVENVGYVPLY